MISGGGPLGSPGAALVSNSRILNNCNEEDGGGMWLGASNAAIRDCVLSGNLGERGSAIEIRDAWGESHPLIQRCLITGNGSPSTLDGGAIYIAAVEARIESCTISGNWALVGGGIFADGFESENTSAWSFAVP